jgi:hypothetical protein
VRSGDLFQSTRDDTFAEVAVPLPAGGPFSYRVPPHATAIVMPGSRVAVSFSGRRLSGIVVATRRRPPEGIAPGKIQEIDDCYDPLPLMSPLLLALTRWIAVRTLSSWGEALRTALPAGIDRVARRRVSLTAAGRVAAGVEAAEGTPVSVSARQLLAALRAARGGTLTLGSLLRLHDGRSTCALLYELARAELVEVEDEWSSGIAGRWSNVVAAARHVSRERRHSDASSSCCGSGTAEKRSKRSARRRNVAPRLSTRWCRAACSNEDARQLPPTAVPRGQRAMTAPDASRSCPASDAPSTASRNSATASTACCCTASPAAARPRSTCVQPRASSSAAAPRCCWCRRSG